MRYIFVMSLSGSMMFLLCLILKNVIGNKYSFLLQFLMMKIAVIYYLLPLPFLKSGYQKLMHCFTGIIKEKNKTVLIYDSNKSSVINVGDQLYFNNFFKCQSIIAVIWMLVALCILLLLIFFFLERKKKIVKCIKEGIGDESETIIKDLKKQLRIKRKIIIIKSNEDEKAFTIGFFKPIIVFSEKDKSLDNEMILQHELIHIKRWDTLWLLLSTFATIMHWWNPIIWVFKETFEQVCEYSCDEILMQGRGREERKKYACLVIEEARKKNKNSTLQLSMGKNADKIEKRMENIMKNKKKLSCFATILIVGIITLFNSATVFAYESICYNEFSGNISEEEINRQLGDEYQSVFIPNGTNTEVEEVNWYSYEIEVLYDEQFIDKEGNIYPVQEQMNTYADCAHQYVSGTYNSHIKNSDGSCMVISYSALRCSKCGRVVIGEEISRSTFKKCPH